MKEISSKDNEQNTTEKVVHKLNSEDLVEQNELEEFEDREEHTKLKRTNEPLGFMEKQFENLKRRGTIG